MNPEYRTLLALGECERKAAAGANVPSVLKSAASVYQVPRGELGLLMLAKGIACRLLHLRQWRQRHAPLPGRQSGDPGLAGAQ